jgi:hypothetical protein
MSVRTPPSSGLPGFYRLTQRFDGAAVGDPAAHLHREFDQRPFAGRLRAGGRVAVAVGSRGISGLAAIVAAVVDCLRSLGLEPFILPAMGSHGGATAEGQTALLRDLGVSEGTVKAPVVSSMEVVSFGHLESGCEVFFARDAALADHVFVINRVKPHTAFTADVESGLCKMLAVGCGKHRGAEAIHTHGPTNIVPAAERILKQAPILGGLSVVENQLERIHTLRLVPMTEFAASDRELLLLARSLLPRIPIDDLDILVVDEIGKNISGAGMDPNVVGFWRRDGGLRRPDFRTLIVLDITQPSHGNALGLGMADMTTRRVYEKIDFKATYTNALTSGVWASARTPIVMPDDRAALAAAWAKVPRPEKGRVARIRNTLNLEHLWVTGEVAAGLVNQPGIEVDPRPLDFEFDAAGRLLPFPDDNRR